MGTWLLAGVPVSMPLTRKDPYDFSVEIEGDIYKVECKLGYSGHRGVLSVDLRRHGTDKRGLREMCIPPDVDLLHIVDPDNLKSYLIPMEDVGKRVKVSLSKYQWAPYTRRKYTFRRTLDRLLAYDA